jgi:hypothetical protein
MKNTKIAAGLVLFTGLVFDSYQLIGAQRASAQIQGKEGYVRVADHTLGIAGPTAALGKSELPRARFACCDRATRG